MEPVSRFAYGLRGVGARSRHAASVPTGASTRAAAKKKGLEESDPNRIRRSVRVKAKDAAPEGKQRAPKRKSSSSLVAKRNPVGGKRPAANNKGRTGLRTRG